MGDIAQHLRAALEKTSEHSSDYDLNGAVNLPPNRLLRPAAVLVGVRETDQGAQVLLTKRSSALKHHPGQIAFPGGKQDADDPDLTSAALREAREEVGLPPQNVEVLGHLPTHETVTGFVVTPVVARLVKSFEERPEAGEVQEVFWVPLAHLADLQNYLVQSRRWRGTYRHFYTVPFGPYYIWGATAAVLRGLAARLA